MACSSRWSGVSGFVSLIVVDEPSSLAAGTSDAGDSLVSVLSDRFFSSCFMIARGGGGGGVRLLPKLPTFAVVSLSLTLASSSCEVSGTTRGGDGGGGIFFSCFESKALGNGEASPTTLVASEDVCSALGGGRGGGGGGILPLEATEGGSNCSKAIVWHHHSVVVSAAKVRILLLRRGICGQFRFVISR